MTHLLFALTLLVLGLNMYFGFPILRREPVALSILIGGVVVIQPFGASRDCRCLSGFRLFAA